MTINESTESENSASELTSDSPAFARMITPEELAAALVVSVRLLYKWRDRGYGPKPVKVGHYLRYTQAEVQRYIDENTPPPD